MPRQRIDVPRAIEMYTHQHLTMEEIGRIFGVTRVAVSKALRKAGIVAAQGERVDTTCATCGAPLNIIRMLWRKNRRHYCDQACYSAARRHPGSVTFRHGTTQARKLVSRYFALQPDHIVHHLDHNQRNNAVTNLIVVAHQGDHMRLHHGVDVPVLWDGRTFAK